VSGRIRTVKPEWLEDELLAAASDEARVLSVGLILMADDYGNGRASTPEIAMCVWRYEMCREGGANARETLAKVSRAIRELLAIRFIGTWSASGQTYFSIRKWADHQKVDKKGKPRVPSPPDNLFDEKPAENEHSRLSRETVASVSPHSRDGLAPDPDLRSPITTTIPTTTASETGPRALDVEPVGELGREVGRLQRAVRDALAGKGAPADLTSPNWTDAATWCRTMVTPTRTLEDVHAQLARGFASEPKAQREGWPTRYLAKNPNQYFSRVTGPTGVARAGYVPPADASEHVATTDEEFEAALRGGP
jgi:hypothetical protein